MEVKIALTSFARSNGLLLIPELKSVYKTKQNLKDKKKDGLLKLMEKNIMSKH